MRVLIADQDYRVRTALGMLIKHESGFTLVGESSDQQGLLSQARALKPDLILLDWEMVGPQAVAGLFAQSEHNRRPKVVILSCRPELEQAALSAGADAFVSKTDPPDQFLSTLRGLAQASAPAR